MSAEFRIGQPVVCVRALGPPLRWRVWFDWVIAGRPAPRVGEVRKIDGFSESDGDLYLTLEGFARFRYRASYFRPVVNKPLEHLVDIAARPDAPLERAPEGPRRRVAAPARS